MKPSNEISLNISVEQLPIGTIEYRQTILKPNKQRNTIKDHTIKSKKLLSDLNDDLQNRTCKIQTTPSEKKSRNQSSQSPMRT